MKSHKVFSCKELAQREFDIITDLVYSVIKDSIFPECIKALAKLWSVAVLCRFLDSFSCRSAFEVALKVAQDCRTQSFANTFMYSGNINSFW